MRRSLIGTLFVIVANIPLLSTSLWRWWYNRLPAWDQGGHLRFMNYGYVPAEGEKCSPQLEATDEPDRLSIQLYEQVLASRQVRGLQLAEVGCGRGGGAAYVARYHRPASLIAVDLAHEAIKEASACFADVPALTFRQGAADVLPIADQSLDGVINVESSHCYPDMAAFLREVARVLRPGGFFAFCDIRLPDRIPRLERLFSESGLMVEHKRDITANVVEALAARDDARIDTITRHLPTWLRRAFFDFSGAPDTVLYQMLAQGRCRYVTYLCVRAV